MKKSNKYKTPLIYIIFLLMIVIFTVNSFNLPIIRVFVFLLTAIILMIALSQFAIFYLKIWLQKKIIMELTNFPTPRDYIYLPVKEKEFLKKEVSEATVIDLQSLDRNRLSNAELEQIEEKFKDTFAFEILERLNKLANGETKALQIFKIEHDLWGLVIINLILLFISFVSVLHIVFILRK